MRSSTAFCCSLARRRSFRAFERTPIYVPMSKRRHGWARGPAPRSGAPPRGLTGIDFFYHKPGPCPTGSRMGKALREKENITCPRRQRCKALLCTLVVVEAGGGGKKQEAGNRKQETGNNALPRTARHGSPPCSGGPAATGAGGFDGSCCRAALGCSWSGTIWSGSASRWPQGGHRSPWTSRRSPASPL